MRLVRFAFVVGILLDSSAAYAQGILPSWMRRYEDAERSEPQTKKRIEYKTIEVKQLPPEILGLTARQSEARQDLITIQGRIKTEAAIHEVRVNDELLTSRALEFKIERPARAGKNEFTVSVTDTRGLKTVLTTSLYVKEPSERLNANRLSPESVKKPARYDDAIALIIGIERYPNISESSYSVNDAKMFQAYSTNALRVDPRRIKILTNEEATRVAILRSIDWWLKSEVSSNTRVYIFYSGHGLATADGEESYIIPSDGDPSYLSETAISLKAFFRRVERLNPKEILAFLDSCYSGQTRAGTTLVADARPIAIKPKANVFGEKTSVFSAASGMELANSDRQKGHGLFSFYLMKGLEGFADSDSDGVITADELLKFVRESTVRDSVRMGRLQNPEYLGSPKAVAQISR